MFGADRVLFDFVRVSDVAIHGNDIRYTPLAPGSRIATSL